jgi:hypothetical protein
MADEVALKQNFSELLQFPLLITVPPLPHTCLSCHLRLATILAKPYTNTPLLVFVLRFSLLTQHLASYNRIKKLHFKSALQHSGDFYAYMYNSESITEQKFKKTVSKGLKLLPITYY